MKLEVGDLVVIRYKSNLQEVVNSFCEKWAIRTSALGQAMVAPTLMWMVTATPSTTKMGTEMVMATLMGTEMGTAGETATKRKTGKKIKLKHYGYNWKKIDQIIGIVTEVIQEDHRDFDVIKIREQTGGTRYCRRYIIEKAQDEI